MPKINIIEKDLTTSNSTTYDDFVVAVLAIPAITPTTEEQATPVLVSNNSGNKEAITFDAFAASYYGTSTSSYGYSTMKELVKERGMTALFVPYSSEESLEDEFDKTIFAKLADRSLYDIRFILTGEAKSVKASKNAIRCAAKRGDAIALIDIPAQIEPEESGTEPTKLDTAEKISKYIENNFTDETITRTYTDGSSVQENIYAYAAAFSPAFKYGSSETQLDATTGYLAAFATYITRFPEWFATAGSIRGVMPYQNVKPTIKLGEIEINEFLTTRNGTKKACNPISLVRPYGNIIYGNRTMFDTLAADVAEFGTGLRASHFLNIRQLCCTLKKVIYRAARRFTFEPNTDVLWVNFCEAIRPTLEKMRTSQGIRAYSIQREVTTEKALLKAKIVISPIEAVEDFDFTVELADEVVVSE